MFVVIVTSDSIAEAGSVHTNESTYRLDQSPLDRAYLYSWDIKVLLASIRDDEKAVYENTLRCTVAVIFIEAVHFSLLITMHRSAAADATATTTADERRLHRNDNIPPHPRDAARFPVRASSAAVPSASNGIVSSDVRDIEHSAEELDDRIQPSENGGVEQLASMTTPIDIPRTPSSPPQVPLAEQLRACRRARVSLELTNRVKELQLPKHDAVQNSKMVDELGEIILNTLRESYPFSFRWDKFNSGSYYDKTKVRYS